MNMQADISEMISFEFKVLSTFPNSPYHALSETWTSEILPTHATNSPTHEHYNNQKHKKIYTK